MGDTLGDPMKKKFDVTKYEDENLVKLKGNMILSHKELGAFIETLQELYNEIALSYAEREP